MDSITHVFLGVAIVQGMVGRRLGWRTAFLLGGLAATFPDFDVFIRTGNTVTDHALHRSFMHALVMVPVIAVVAALPFLSRARLRPMWRGILLGAFLATLSHPLLDALTSYGTQLFWPFSSQRVALDVVAVVDVFYTAVLIAGVVMAWRRGSARWAWIALAVSTVYLGVAFVQHGRAQSAQREILALRGNRVVENARVLPEVGAVLNYRSIYVREGRIYADAIRVPFFGAARVKVGGSVEAVADVPPTASAQMREDFATFRWFADGYVARDPMDGKFLGDVRYTGTLEGFDAVWGIRLREGGGPVWELFSKRRYVAHLWEDMVRPRGYLPLGSPVP